MHFLLWTKGFHQSPNFDTSKLFWWKFVKQQIGFSSNFASLFIVMRQTPLYFFSWNFVYFQQKEPIKVQIWWNLTWAVEILKFRTLMGSFCPNHIKFQLKKYRRVHLWLKSDAKLKLTCGFTFIWFREFSPNHSKVWKFQFDGLFLSNVRGLS